MRPTRSPPTRTSARVTRWTTVFMPRSMIQLVGVSLAALVVLLLGELVPDAGAAPDAPPAAAHAGPSP